MCATPPLPHPSKMAINKDLYAPSTRSLASLMGVAARAPVAYSMKENVMNARSFAASAPAESSAGGIAMYSPAFYAACTVGGIASCGLTHTLVTPLDIVKCNMQARGTCRLLQWHHEALFWPLCAALRLPPAPRRSPLTRPRRRVTGGPGALQVHPRRL